MNRTDAILARSRAGDRLNADDALILLTEADLNALGQAAHERRLAMHPEPIVTYVVDRNINYTNVCVSGCRFCAYFRDPDAPDAFVITRESLGAKIQETIALGGTQILLQGGMHPHLPLSFYEEMLEWIKSNFAIHIHGFSPSEISHMASVSDLDVPAVIHRLITAGLDSIPGGGAEILVDEIRTRISPHKCSADQWLAVMAAAHGAGLKTTATMMFGHVESPADRIAHLDRIRALQDMTGGFTAFIPWTFQPDNTRLPMTKATAAEYLRMLAVSRLFLDNVPNLQASWVTQGDKIAQVALFFGANDLGSTMIEENVVAAAGVRFRLPLADMRRLIDAAGFHPRQRDCFYRPVVGKRISA